MSEKENGLREEINVSSKECASMDQKDPAKMQLPVIDLSSKTNKKESSILLLPGIESRLSDFNLIVPLLNANTWGVNYSSNGEIDTIEKEANTCLEVCLERCRNNQDLAAPKFVSG